MRLAFGRVAQETNAYSPVHTTLADLRRTHWLEGPALLEACSKPGREVPAFGRRAELTGFVEGLRAHVGIEPVPLLSVWGIPGGPLERAAFDDIRTRLVGHLRAAGPLDGVYLAMHGALRAEHDSDPEASLLQAAREVVGPKVPIAASWDLHGQMTRAKMQQLDISTAYRTNPHRDHARVGRRTADILARTALGLVRPTHAWRSLPMVLGGGTTIDFLPTMRPLYRAMARMERHPRVLYASLFNVHLWNDHPDLGWSASVLTDDDPHLAEALADELAELAWGVRHEAPPAFHTPQEAIALARQAVLARSLGVVTLCDASDVVGAGAPGENTALLRALLEEARDMVSYAPIRDAQAVQQLWDLTPGSTVNLEVGGRLHPEQSAPLAVHGRLLRRIEHSPFGRELVLDLGSLKLVITEEAPLAMKPAFYRDVGLPPFKADLVVVKSLFPFRRYFVAHSRKTLYVRTRGVTDLDHGRRAALRHPVHPWQVVDEWRPTDRARRQG